MTLEREERNLTSKTHTRIFEIQPKSLEDFILVALVFSFVLNLITVGFQAYRCRTMAKTDPKIVRRWIRISSGLGKYKHL